MDRRKTILTATLINAALLCLLFVIFMQPGEEEVLQRSAVEGLSMQKEETLFNSESTLSLREEAPMPVIQPLLIEPQITHQLPSPMPTATLPQPVEMAPAPLAPATAMSAAIIEVTVQKGDSLDKLARAYRTTMEEILRMNKLSGNILRIGQVLKIPDVRAIGSATKAKPVAEKVISELAPEYYTVKVGDNPWGIAMKHHIKVEELLKLNNLNEERARRLKPGDRLRIK